jgi:hypothetical protein
VQRDRHDAICIRQHIGAARPHYGRERLRQRPAAAVFECVDDFPECAVIFTDGTGSADGSALSRTLTAPFRCARQRVSARVADRRCNRPNRRPARSADATFDRAVQYRLTHRTRRRQNRRNQSICRGTDLMHALQRGQGTCPSENTGVVTRAVDWCRNRDVDMSHRWQELTQGPARAGHYILCWRRAAD